MIITIVQQIIVNIDMQIANQTKPIVWSDLTITNQTWRDQEFYTEISNIIEENWWSILRVIEFYTTVVWPQETKLVKVQGVDMWYPRYGEIIIKDIITQETFLSTELASSDEVRIDSETYAIIEQSDSIQVWNGIFPIKWIITEQPNIWFNFFDEGRTIIMSYDLVDQTDLTDFWSRVSHELQVKTTTDDQAESIKNIIDSKYSETLRVRLARDRIEQLWGIIDQLNQYTSIVLIITLILSLIVMATATMTMTLKIRTSIAIMRVIGVTRIQTAYMTTLLFGTVFIIGSLIGIGCAYVLFVWVGTTIQVAKDFVWYPLQLLTIGWIAAISFIVTCRQSILHLSTTHPLSLLKQSDAKTTHTRYTKYILILWAWILLAILTKEIRFSLIVVTILIWLLSIWYRLLMKLFQYIHKLLHPIRAKYFLRFDASRQTIVPWNQTGILVGWLTSALLGFCIIVSVSLSFLDRLDTSAIDQPNIFILNVRNDDIEKIKKFDPQARLYDTILWRISHINGTTISDFLAGKESEEFTREFNITTQALANSSIIQGTALRKWGISLDQDFARQLGVWIGDKVTIFIQGRSFDLTISSLRRSIRTWAEPFFFLQIDPIQFEQAPRSWFWVTRQPEDMIATFQQSAIDTIWRHLSFINISVVIGLVTDISQKIISVIIVCMSIVIILIMLVSIASNEASALTSKRTYWLYHIIGMTKKQLISISWYVGLLYIATIIFILLLSVPIILYIIYKQASILMRAWQNTLPIVWGIIITTMTMIISYSSFHKSIIKKLQ